MRGEGYPERVTGTEGLVGSMPLSWQRLQVRLWRLDHVHHLNTLTVTERLRMWLRMSLVVSLVSLPQPVLPLNRLKWV